MRSTCCRFGLYILLMVLAASTSVKANEFEVLPLMLREKPLPEVTALQNRTYQVIQRQAKYLLPQVHPWDSHPEYALITASKSDEHHIRPNTGMIMGLAFLYRFGPYDSNIVGCDRETLLKDYIFPMMRYCVVTHSTGFLRTDDGNSWGDAWQSAHWSDKLGVAAWWIWDDLPNDLREGVRKVVAHEAERIAGQTPPFQLHADTKAEENAWKSQIFQAAVLLMPNDSRRKVWETQYQEWVLSSFLRPADEYSKRLIDGKPVSEQFRGANMLDDFTLENHRIVHPDYMAAYNLTLGYALQFDMSHRTPPEAIRHNVAGLYENLKWFSLPDGGVIYPSGQDWELFRNPNLFYKHLLMAVYGNDSDAWMLANRSFDTLEKMQQRDLSGRIWDPTETFFASANSDLFSQLGLCWLMLQQARKIENQPKRLLGIRKLESGKILLHRTSNSIHSISWGAKVMVMTVPLQQDRVISPHQSAGVGQIRIAGDKKPLTVHLKKIVVQPHKEGFVADLEIVHGEDHVRAEIHVESFRDGLLRFSEKLFAIKETTTTDIATGLIPILNNPKWVYEQGEREISFDKVSMKIVSLSGDRFLREGVQEIQLNQVLRIQSKNSLNASWHGAKKVERGRATDLLYLNAIPNKRIWKAGQKISEFDVEIEVIAHEAK